MTTTTTSDDIFSVDVTETDFDGDGISEGLFSEVQDLDDNGVIDSFLMDTDADGYIETVMVDTDDNGLPETAILDLDADGTFDAAMIIDESVFDTDFDSDFNIDSGYDAYSYDDASESCGFDF